MYDAIAQILLIASLGMMMYIIARAAPRIGDDISVLEEKKKKPFLNLEKIDTVLNTILEKFLRRTKLILMQLDNIVSGYLYRVRHLNKYKKEEKPNLFENLQNDPIIENPDQEQLFKN